MTEDNPFSPTSGAGSAPQLVPDKTLHFATVHTVEIKNSKRTNGTYARIELSLIDGPFEGRKVWTMIMNPLDPLNRDEGKRAEGKPDGAAMGLTALTRMLEACRVFDPANHATYQKFKGKTFTDILQALEGQKVAIKIKISKGTDGYEDKNEVAEWLSPNPESGGHKPWLALVGGMAPVAQARAGALTAQPVAKPSAPAGGSVPPWMKGPQAAR